MAVLRTTTNTILHTFAQSQLPLPLLSRRTVLISPNVPIGTIRHEIVEGRIRCAASDSNDGAGQKFSSRMSQMQQLLQDAEERAFSADNQPPPIITLDNVTVSFARSGGPGGQNVNKVNTKVDMRFNVQNATWLSDRIKEKILQTHDCQCHDASRDFSDARNDGFKSSEPRTSREVYFKLRNEKKRINKDGELVISSTRTRTQKGNIEDALEKFQEIIDAASYVPPPPSEEQKKKIAKIAAIGEQKRLKSKKEQSEKKSFRRSKDSLD